jgi:hypothetical protein
MCLSLGWPLSSSGYRYILTLVDFATRYPEAVPLKRIETVDVAEALISIFARVGLPREILSDRGTQFTSDLMNEIARLLSVKQLTTTPYHAMSNGLVEKFNGVLKFMLKRMCDERPRDWDRYIPALLFAYREVPQESLGFSPFEMLYGRSVRGPMSVLKELWSGDVTEDDVKSSYQYVLELRDRLQDTCELAHEELKRAKLKQKTYYDRKTKKRSFRIGDSVLLLLPTDNNKLLMKWKGPYSVVEKVSENDYKINIDGRCKTFHANMLKLYLHRETSNKDAVTVANAVVVTQEIDEECLESRDLLFCPLKGSETWKDVNLCQDLGDEKNDLKQLLREFSSVFTDLPGKTDLLECRIDVTDNTPVRQKPYPVPFSVRKSMNDEVKKMQEMGVIEDSVSQYCSPSVIVRKPDGSHRYCIDFRKLNLLSQFDSEPVPNQDVIIAELGNSSYFSRLDLSKGFWQIPIAVEDRHKTAFATENGLKQFVVMPFGLVNATSVFCRMMRKLLEGVPNAHSYVDDLVIHTKTWQEHLTTLRVIFQRLREHGLTARPTKCFLGFREIEFLGQKVGMGFVKPTEAKVQGILKVERPTTKSELRSYLGMISYQRKYIPMFADNASPLTDLLKKGKPNIIQWNDKAEYAFQYFKDKLSGSPILRLPDFSKEMHLAVDSSGIGIGGVLMQQYNGQYFPVLYISRKLKPAEINYSAIERECLALVWAVKTLHHYLYGREFVLLSDHQPLLYINSAKMSNSRVMRWAIDLQVHRFKMKIVKGSENNIADYLSRKGLDNS